MPNERAPGLTASRKRLLEHWSIHPWNYLSALDEDGTPIIWTKDEKDKKNPIKSFPREKPYLEVYIDVLFRENLPILDKSRQMMATTCAILMAHTDCAFNYARRWLLNKNTEKEAQEILADKVRFPWIQQPEWVREALPLTLVPKGVVHYPNTDSYILAVDSKSYAGELRGGTCSGVIIDEAAYQSKLPEILQAALAMTDKVIMLTTAEIGNPGARLYRELLERSGEGAYLGT